MGTFVSEEVLEDGTKKISTYDDKTHKLLGYYHINSDGKKHGQEIEYDKNNEIKAERTYESGECIKSKEVVPFSSIKDFLIQNTTARGLFDNEMGGYFDRVDKVTVIKENGEYKHIKIDASAHLDRDGDVYTRIFDMEFKDGKEYNGYFKAEYPRRETVAYQYKEGCLDGDILTMEQDGKYIDGKFSGKKYVSLQDSPCVQFVEENTFEGIDCRNHGHIINSKGSKCYQVIENGTLVSDNAIIQIDNISSWAAREKDGQMFNVYIPVTGTAMISHHGDAIYSVQVKDGKKNGQYLDVKAHETGYFKDNELDGKSISYYDREMQIKREEVSFKNGELDGAYIEYFEPTKEQKGKYDEKIFKERLSALSKGEEVSEEPLVGNKKVEGFYKDGQKHGIWKYYTEEGKVIKTEFWNLGKDETLKYAAMRKVAAKHCDEAEPKTQIGKTVTKAIKTVEILNEIRKAKKQKGN